MSRLEIIADEDLPAVVVAAALRRIAQLLDPLPPVQSPPPDPPASVSVAPRPRRSHPAIPGIHWDTSRSGTLLSCSRCDWRSGPHRSEELAEPFGRTHSVACRRPAPTLAGRRA